MFINKVIRHSKKIILCCFLFSIFSFLILHNYQSEKVQGSLSKNVVRFHIRANSDTLLDQSLKMKVKTKVINYINSASGGFNSLDEAKTFIQSHDSEIVNVALNEIHRRGYSYNIASDFNIQDFPCKTYGDFSFPSGKYLSYTLNIGSGEGHNWWCVLYPPLCFVDESTGILPEESKEQVKENISEEDYQYVSSDSPVFRFKYLTFLNSFIN